MSFAQGLAKFKQMQKIYSNAQLILSSEFVIFWEWQRGRGTRKNMTKCDMGETGKKILILGLPHFLNVPLRFAPYFFFLTQPTESLRCLESYLWRDHKHREDALVESGHQLNFPFCRNVHSCTFVRERLPWVYKRKGTSQ